MAMESLMLFFQECRISPKVVWYSEKTQNTWVLYGSLSFPLVHFWGLWDREKSNTHNSHNQRNWNQNSLLMLFGISKREATHRLIVSGKRLRITNFCTSRGHCKDILTTTWVLSAHCMSPTFRHTYIIILFHVIICKFPWYSQYISMIFPL